MPRLTVPVLWSVPKSVAGPRFGPRPTAPVAKSVAGSVPQPWSDRSSQQCSAAPDQGAKTCACRPPGQQQPNRSPPVPPRSGRRTTASSRARSPMTQPGCQPPAVASARNPGRWIRVGLPATSAGPQVASPRAAPAGAGPCRCWWRGAVRGSAAAPADGSPRPAASTAGRWSLPTTGAGSPVPPATGSRPVRDPAAQPSRAAPDGPSPPVTPAVSSARPLRLGRTSAARSRGPPGSTGVPRSCPRWRAVPRAVRRARCPAWTERARRTWAPRCAAPTVTRPVAPPVPAHRPAEARPACRPARRPSVAVPSTAPRAPVRTVARRLVPTAVPR